MIDIVLSAPLQASKTLGDLEAVIARGLNTFVEVGAALSAIRDRRLYRETHGTFEDYCRERWCLKQSRAYQIMDAAAAMSNLESSTIVELPDCRTLPANEAQVRPLTLLPADEQPAAWNEVLSRSRQEGAPITAALVEDVVSGMKPKINRPGDINAPAAYDACQTPPCALDPLLPYLPREWTIWEPAAGEGSIVESLFDGGFLQGRVAVSDIVMGQNFFDYEPDRWDCLVTNPPYSIKYQWLERCYSLGKPFALLMPVETLGAARAQACFIEHGLQLILLNRRVNFKMPNKGWDGSSAQFPTAWFCSGLPLPSQITFGRMGDK